MSRCKPTFSDFRKASSNVPRILVFCGAQPQLVRYLIRLGRDSAAKPAWLVYSLLGIWDCWLITSSEENVF